MQWLLEHVHIYSGLPWSLSIIATTLLVRVGVFYFYIRQADTAARTAALSPIVKPLNEKMLERMRAGDQQTAMTYRKQISAVYKDADIHPFKAALGPLMQAMLGFGAFRLIRGMADLPVPGLQSEGLLWIADLTKSDPYMILPVAVAGMMHLVVRVRTNLSPPLTHPIFLDHSLRTAIDGRRIWQQSAQPHAAESFPVCHSRRHLPRFPLDASSVAALLRHDQYPGLPASPDFPKTRRALLSRHRTHRQSHR